MVTLARKALSRYAKDDDALVTIQVVLFSVMLFGAIGFVIDFGRAYSAHSQMQSYIDQVALAAAAQLDQRDGTDRDGVKVEPSAIERATAAAYAVSKTSTFTQGGGEFQIAQLIFLTGAPTDEDGNFDYALVTGGTLTTTNPALATHVLAIAQPASVRASLLDINIGGLGSSINEIPIGAYAVATRKQVTCDGLSTLVMCNPFEGDPDRSLASVFEDGGGFRIRLTADAGLGLSTTATEIGVGVIKNPVATLGTDSGACEDVTTLPGYDGQTGAELEALRDKCLLAVVDTGLSCVNDSLLVKEIPPGDLVTGLDVLFDMYDDEMAAILTSDVALGDGRMRSELFYPDIAAVHGRLHLSEIPDYYDAKRAQIDADSSIPPFLKTARKNALSQQETKILAAYPGDPAHPASRLNHIPIEPSAHGPMESPVCFASDCLSFGLHGGIYNGDIQPVDYATSYYTPTVRDLTAAQDGRAPESLSSSDLDGELLTQGAETFYQFYSMVERIDPSLRTFAASNGVTWNGITNNFVRTWPENFAAAYPGVDMSGRERRRIRVSVVNCGAKESVDAGDGTQAYRAQVVDVVDLFITQPPKVISCTTAYDSNSDPQGIRPCANDEITKAELHVEYVGSVKDNLIGSRSRSYAVLVH
ncbi:MAG: hypothetical protein D6686_03110 [Alphaproteobacteria bacterium]|nr:MAG: hypothetical protein D6686_03110 [Alphaproteobacteria bacterium]